MNTPYIGKMVKDGLPDRIQKALDIVRVIGNNAVHPGELNGDDISEVSLQLFSLINFIVDEMISKPKKLDELFGKLPEGSIKAIQKRDNK